MNPVLISPAGTRLPAILYGTAWKKESTARLVEQAITLGFRGIDTACQPKHYDEPGVGRGVAACVARGLRREELYLQTKFTPVAGQDRRNIPYDPTAGPAHQVVTSSQASLRNLRTSYLDCLVLHSPISPFEKMSEVWRAMEGLVDAGVTKELGVSNCYDPAVLEKLWRGARVKPCVVQNRFYEKTGFDREVRAFCLRQGLFYQSFWTLTANPHILAHAAVSALASRYAVTPAQIFFRCLTQVGIIPLTGTTSAEHMREDLAIFDFELKEPELAELVALFS